MSKISKPKYTCPEDEAPKQDDDGFQQAAHKYLMDNQDTQMAQSVTELLSDWALDAFNAGWDAQQKRIAELEAEKAGYKKAAEYWKENYDRLRGTGKSLRGISRSEGGGDD